MLFRSVCDEESEFGYGLAPFVGRAWEQAFEQAVLPQMRSVVFRTSFVLGRTGGALPRLALLVRCGLGGRAGRTARLRPDLHELDARMARHAARIVRERRINPAGHPAAHRDDEQFHATISPRSRSRFMAAWRGRQRTVKGRSASRPTPRDESGARGARPVPLA